MRLADACQWAALHILGEERSDEHWMPDSAVKHGEPEGWMVLKPFDNLRRPTRARCSERHAECDVREPVRRAGAGVAVASAAAASMSVRRPRTRQMTFVNGNRDT